MPLLRSLLQKKPSSPVHAEPSSVFNEDLPPSPLAPRSASS
ncbi:hypothetical protein Hanom_Chr11g01018301 [Helianthus anomalus]